MDPSVLVLMEFDCMPNRRLLVQYISRWLAPHPLPMRASLYNNMQVQLNLHM